MTDTTKLTAKETAALKVFPDAQYLDGRWAPGESTWSFDFTEMVAVAAKTTLSAAKGVISSLVKKGFVKTGGEGDDSWIAITDKGFDRVNDLRADEDGVKYDPAKGWVPLGQADEAEVEVEAEPVIDGPVDEPEDEDLIGGVAEALEEFVEEQKAETKKAKKSTKKGPALPKQALSVLAREIQVGDEILDYTVGKVTVGRVRTTVWADDNTELLYTLNNLNVWIVR